MTHLKMITKLRMKIIFLFLSFESFIFKRDKTFDTFFGKDFLVPRKPPKLRNSKSVLKKRFVGGSSKLSFKWNKPNHVQDGKHLFRSVEKQLKVKARKATTSGSCDDTFKLIESKRDNRALKVVDVSM